MNTFQQQGKLVIEDNKTTRMCDGERDAICPSMVNPPLAEPHGDTVSVGRKRRFPWRTLFCSAGILLGGLVIFMLLGSTTARFLMPGSAEDNSSMVPPSIVDAFPIMGGVLIVALSIWALVRRPK